MSNHSLPILPFALSRAPDTSDSRACDLHLDPGPSLHAGDFHRHGFVAHLGDDAVNTARCHQPIAPNQGSDGLLPLLLLPLLRTEDQKVKEPEKFVPCSRVRSITFDIFGSIFCLKKRERVIN